MCRFTVRAPASGGRASQPQDLKFEAPLDLDVLFADGNDDLDANDLALLALFNGTGNASAEAELEEPAQKRAQQEPSPVGSFAGTNTLGQALCAPQPPEAAHAPQPVVAMPFAASPLPADPVQQLQFQAVLQHQAAVMQNPQAFPAATQMYQQALLQQQLLGAQLPAIPARSGMPACYPLVSKRGKTVDEVEEQTERVKKRRRESAQRSRQRKNAYMKSLEMENRALKMENERLRLELSKGSVTGGPAATLVPKVSSGSVSRHFSAGGAYSGPHGIAHDTDVMSLSDDEDDRPLCPGMGLAGCLQGSTPDFVGDALGLPGADLLNFAF